MTFIEKFQNFINLLAKGVVAGNIGVSNGGGVWLDSTGIRLNTEIYPA